MCHPGPKPPYLLCQKFCNSTSIYPWISHYSSFSAPPPPFSPPSYFFPLFLFPLREKWDFSGIYDSSSFPPSGPGAVSSCPRCGHYAVLAFYICHRCCSWIFTFSTDNWLNGLMCVCPTEQLVIWFDSPFWVIWFCLSLHLSLLLTSHTSSFLPSLVSLIFLYARLFYIRGPWHFIFVLD